MIATDKFVFVHLPRTGGTFVTEVIRKFFPSAWEIGHHLPRDLMPSKYSHLPVLGTVRNPWDFYISLYHYVLMKGPKTILAAWMSDHGRLGVTDSIRTLVSLGTNVHRLDALTDMLPESVDYRKRQIPNVTKAATRKIRGMPVGYYTFRFNEMFGNANNVFFCRLETLKEDLITFFDRIDVTTNELQDYVLSSAKKNSSEHLHYSTYYTRDLAEMVLAHDRIIIEKFGYTFENNLPMLNSRMLAWSTTQ